MKRWIAFLSALLMLLCLTGCGNTVEEPEQVITMAAKEPEDTAAAPEAARQEPYGFDVNGVTLIPGTDFDPAVPGEALSVFEAPSCAIEGMDIVYQYGSFEITAVDDGSRVLLYSVYLLDPNAATPEGLCLGDSRERALSLYGEPSAKEEDQWVYAAGSTQLILLFSGEAVSSIEYRMVT